MFDAEYARSCQSLMFSHGEYAPQNNGRIVHPTVKLDGHQGRKRSRIGNLGEANEADTVCESMCHRLRYGRSSRVLVLPIPSPGLSGAGRRDPPERRRLNRHRSLGRRKVDACAGMGKRGRVWTRSSRSRFPVKPARQCVSRHRAIVRRCEGRGAGEHDAFCETTE